MAELLANKHKPKHPRYMHATSSSLKCACPSLTSADAAVCSSTPAEPAVHCPCLLQMLMASTGNGWVVPVLITENPAQGGLAAAPLPYTSTEQPVFWGCWYSSASTSSAITNTGGTGICSKTTWFLFLFMEVLVGACQLCLESNPSRHC